MTFILNDKSNSQPIAVKTTGIGREEVVYLGEYTISMSDFMEAAHYVLTNTDLQPGDPRFQFIRCVQAMVETPGFNTLFNPNCKSTRLVSSILPTNQVVDVEPG